VFSRRERLPRAAFPVALKRGRRLSSPHFLLVVPEEGMGYAVVIPKKVVRLSVARHRLKRQVLEILRASALPKALIVFPRSAVGAVSYEDLKAELEILLSRLPTHP
jgi:ribonuclease P protein component